jgi:N-acetylmuramoyl-L-alanine amidase
MTLPTMSKELIAICVGHSREVGGRPEGGAVSVGSQRSEWHYNSILARVVADDLASLYGVRSVVVDHYEGGSYGSAMRWLAAELRERDVAAAVELHFNSADSPTARGHEWLYWGSSKRGHALATQIDRQFRRYESQIPPRGTKPRVPGDRGALFLSETHCPAVIAEPFFGSSWQDFEIALRDMRSIGGAIAHGVADWLG